MNRKETESTIKGSITVEASIIIPTVILTVIAVIYMSVLWFHYAFIKSTANTAAERGAVSWNFKERHVGTGKVYKDFFKKRNLYWRFGDRDKEAKLQKIKEYINRELDRYHLLTPLDVKVGVVIKEYIIYKKLVVTIENSYRVPAAGLLKVFGFSDTYVIRVQSEALIDDPTEFIRNTDFVIDVERELENKCPEFKDVAEKARDVLSKTKEKVNDFIN